MFPVKLTDPFTAILYVTSDKAHIEELKHTIHVHEINEGTSGTLNFQAFGPKQAVYSKILNIQLRKSLAFDAEPPKKNHGYPPLPWPCFTITNKKQPLKFLQKYKTL